jgi:putative adenylate-forming enzyme
LALIGTLDRAVRLALVHRLRRSFYGWDAAHLRRHQQQRLDELVAYVARRSPYYRTLRERGWDGSFERLPQLSKAEMIEHFDEINTAGLRQADLFEFAVRHERDGSTGLFPGGYSVGLSSGTSGSRLPTVLGPSERRQYGSLLFARSGIPDSIRLPRVLFLLRVSNPAFLEARFLGVTIVYADYTHPVGELTRLINDNRLNVLAGPPSMLRLIASERNQIDHPIEALISYAEVLDDQSRGQLERDFEAPLAQVYQGAEGFIASTCRAGSLHVNEDVVHVEAEGTDDALGDARRVVVTDLYRRVQPFLRYQLNDVLELDAGPCACGSVFRLVKRIHGRADDIFVLRSTAAGPETVPGAALRHLFPDYVTRSINQASESIVEFQAIQHSPDRIEIRLQLAPGADRPAIEAAIRANLAFWAGRVGGRLGDVEFPHTAPERNPRSLKLIRVERRF